MQQQAFRLKRVFWLFWGTYNLFVGYLEVGLSASVGRRSKVITREELAAANEHQSSL